jgi:hypothetical protein
MDQALGVQHKVVPVKEQSHPADVYLGIQAQGLPAYLPMQLKELPPADLNPTSELNAFLKELASDPPAPRTSLAIYLNRRLYLGKIVLPVLPYESVYLYGRMSEDRKKWWLFRHARGQGQGQWHEWKDLSLLL